MKESTKLRTDPKQAAELSPKAAKQPAPKHHTPLKRRVEPYIWLLPSIVMMGVLILIPIITVFQTSFSEISKAGVFKGFNGVVNYLWIFKQPAFRTTLKNTVVWTVVVVGLSTILGIVLGLVLKSVVVDTVIESLNRRKSFLAVTSCPQELCDFITHTLHRSATYWQAEGAYTHEPKWVVLTALSRSQAVALRLYLKSTDPHAFILVTSSSEIFGKGFLQA